MSPDSPLDKKDTASEGKNYANLLTAEQSKALIDACLQSSGTPVNGTDSPEGLYHRMDLPTGLHAAHESKLAEYFENHQNGSSGRQEVHHFMENLSGKLNSFFIDKWFGPTEFDHSFQFHNTKEGLYTSTQHHNNFSTVDIYIFESGVCLTFPEKNDHCEAFEDIIIGPNGQQIKIHIYWRISPREELDAHEQVGKHRDVFAYFFEHYDKLLREIQQDFSYKKS